MEGKDDDPHDEMMPKPKPKVRRLGEGEVFNHEEWKHDLYEQLMD